MTKIYEDFIEEHEKKEEQWEFVALKEKFICKRCGNPPLFDERQIYFDTGYCGYCAHMAEQLEKE